MRIGGRSLEQTNRRNYIFMCVHVSNRRVLPLSLSPRARNFYTPVLKYRCVCDFAFVEERARACQRRLRIKINDWVSALDT